MDGKSGSKGRQVYIWVSGFSRLEGSVRVKGVPSHKDTEKLLRATLPDVLIDNFDVDRFEKADTRFDVWLGPKKYGCALR